MYGTTTAELGGKIRTLKFNINADIEYERMHNLSGKSEAVRKEIASGISLVEWVRDAIYCALKSADLEAGRSIDYNQFTVGDWITAIEQTELERILLVRSDAMPKNDTKKKESQ
jgi:hypothetical protein